MLAMLKLSNVAGDFPPYHVQLNNYPVFACIAKHEIREAYKDFNTYWRSELLQNKGLWSKPHGLFRKRHACARCGNDINKSDITEGVCSVNISCKEGGDFTIDISGPVLKCRLCDTRQINYDHIDGIFEALANALMQSSIKRY
jgi:hypothetical protein